MELKTVLTVIIIVLLAAIVMEGALLLSESREDSDKSPEPGPSEPAQPGSEDNVVAISENNSTDYDELKKQIDLLQSKGGGIVFGSGSSRIGAGSNCIFIEGDYLIIESHNAPDSKYGTVTEPKKSLPISSISYFWFDEYTRS